MPCFCLCTLVLLLTRKEIRTEKYAVRNMHPLSFAFYGAGITSTYQSRLSLFSLPWLIPGTGEQNREIL